MPGRWTSYRYRWRSRSAWAWGGDVRWMSRPETDHVAPPAAAAPACPRRHRPRRPGGVPARQPVWAPSTWGGAAGGVHAGADRRHARGQEGAGRLPGRRATRSPRRTAVTLNPNSALAQLAAGWINTGSPARPGDRIFQRALDVPLGPDLPHTLTGLSSLHGRARGGRAALELAGRPSGDGPLPSAHRSLVVALVVFGAGGGSRCGAAVKGVDPRGAPPSRAHPPAMGRSGVG